MIEKLIAGTDCSGLGSFEEALKRLLVEHTIAFACDKDAHVKKSYLANHQPEVFYDDLVTRDQSKTPYCNFYVAGFPCQAFSLVGNRKGFEDTRGTLFFHDLEYVAKKKPRVFVFENVRGLLSHDKPKNSKSQFGKTFGVIRDALGVTVNGQHNLYKYDDCVNYHIFYKILNSKDFGVPQNRERIFIIGFRDEEDAVKFQFPKPVPLKLRLKDMLESNVDEKYFISETMLKWFQDHSSKNKAKGNGFNFKPTDVEGVARAINQRVYKCGTEDNYVLVEPEPQVLIQVRSEYGKEIRKDFEAGKIKDPWRTMKNFEPRKDGISNTLRSVQKDNLLAIPDKKGIILINGIRYLIRRLTPKECFRLMGYDDDFFEKCAVANSDTQLYRQAGNSIVVDVMARLLIQILVILNIPFVNPYEKD
jgi:DNA (cytosine-5)-methyltransferase 1